MHDPRHIFFLPKEDIKKGQQLFWHFENKRSAKRHRGIDAKTSKDGLQLSPLLQDDSGRYCNTPGTAIEAQGVGGHYLVADFGPNGFASELPGAETFDLVCTILKAAILDEDPKLPRLRALLCTIMSALIEKDLLDLQAFVESIRPKKRKEQGTDQEHAAYFRKVADPQEDCNLMLHAHSICTSLEPYLNNKYVGFQACMYVLHHGATEAVDPLEIYRTKLSGSGLASKLQSIMFLAVPRAPMEEEQDLEPFWPLGMCKVLTFDEAVNQLTNPPPGAKDCWDFLAPPEVLSAKEGDCWKPRGLEVRNFDNMVRVLLYFLLIAID